MKIVKICYGLFEEIEKLRDIFFARYINVLHTEVCEELIAKITQTLFFRKQN